MKCTKDNKSADGKRSTEGSAAAGKAGAARRPIPELLAPAGGMKQLAAAVENGADAVYLGGPLFNARIHADNFTDPELKEAIDYAHLRNVKVYITLNILLTDEELLPALRYAERLYEMGADALILQDIGLADLIKTRLPDFPLHLSTQGSVYNLSGVKKAEQLGFQRVVLARELSLAEIKAITAQTSCPVEIFAHGALCMCYSGQCQLSRALGDGSRSGNRGLCAQPCRLPYTPLSEPGAAREKGQNQQKAKAGYILSPKDLCTIDCLGELAEAGAASLKIEGRMKFPEYVAAVTAIYRKYLDQYAAKGWYTVSEEDRYTLNQVFNRGSFTSGYLYGNPGPRLLSGRLPKHQGVYIGRVAASRKGSALVDVKLEKPLHMGDGVEIRSQELTGNIVTYLEPEKGGLVRIGDIKGSVKPGDAVYRITDAELMQTLRQTYEQGGPRGSKHRRKIPIHMEFHAEQGTHPSLTIREEKLEVTVTCGEETVQQAQNRPLTEEAAVRQLKKTGGTPFEAETIKTHIEEGSSLPVSAINRLRRAALEAFSQKKLQAGRREEGMIPKELDDKTAVNGRQRVKNAQSERPGEAADGRAKTNRSLAFYFLDSKTILSGIKKLKQTGAYLGADEKDLRAYVPLRFFMEQPQQKEETGISFIPYILNISRGRLDGYIREHFEEIVQRTKGSGISIGNLSWIDEFSARGVPVYGDYGLNLYNSRARYVFEAQGFVLCAESLEMLGGKYGKNRGNGSFPLMITEHPIRAQRLVDRKNQGYKIVYNSESDKAMLFFGNAELNLEDIKKRWKREEGEIRIYII